MKQNNNNRRARGRGPRKPHGMGGGSGHNKGQGYDGGGQELRVRGNAYQVLEKYLQLARDAGSAGDRVAAENFLQHADHYYRVLSAMNDGQRPRMGGRELSVADVNVQNVSQGLSAALYSSGGANPQGIDSGMSDGMQGQNPGNQSGQGQGGQSHGGQGHGNQGHGGQGGHRQGGHQHGGHQQGGHQQSARSQGDGQGQNPNQQNVSGNVAQANGHGNSYDTYTERSAAQPSYAAPAEPARPASQPSSEEQPDYPEELLTPAAAPAAAPETAADDAEEGVQRTLRTPRPRLRGPGRRGSRQGEGRQAEGRQDEPRSPDGQGSAESGE